MKPAHSLKLWQKRWLGFWLCLGLVACQGGDQSHSLIYCSEGSPVKLNPQVAVDGTSITASARTVFDRLVEYKLGESSLVPGLAERWMVSDDGLTYTFYLRKNVSFHSNSLFTPTRHFNADDVLYSFGRMSDVKHPLHSVGGGIYEYYQSLGMDKNIKQIVKAGDHVVKIFLRRAEAPFLSYIATHHMSIMSREYGEKLLALGKPELFDMKPIGTGPFVLKKYIKDTLIRYSAVKDHFSKAPLIDQLIFSITPDPSVRFQKLKTGECHLAAPSRSDLAAMAQHPEIKLASRQGLNVGYLAMNTQKPPFDKRKVRQAVNMALNKKAYIDTIYFNHAVVAKNPLPPAFWGYNDQVKDYSYDPQRAKKLLAEAGFAQGFSSELWALPISRPYNPDGKKMAEMMQADLKKIGIEVKIVSYDWGTYLEKSRLGEHAMIQLGWMADYMDPDNFLGVLLSCSTIASGLNMARFCHQGFEQLVQKAKTITSRKARAKLYRQAQVVFRREAPWVTLAHARFYRAMRKNVQGFVLDLFGGDYFHTVYLE